MTATREDDSIAVWGCGSAELTHSIVEMPVICFEGRAR